MLKVIDRVTAKCLLNNEFNYKTATETVKTNNAVGRYLSEDIFAFENLPSFTKSTVDGYAVIASDTFGSSESMPTLFKFSGSIMMGEKLSIRLENENCYWIPTGGALPEGADAVVMLEDAIDYENGIIGVYKPVAPGTNLIIKGDDIKKDEVLFSKGHRIKTRDIGALSALGISSVSVHVPPRVAIISTGEELVSAETKNLKGAQIRDINGPLLCKEVLAAGGIPVLKNIVNDNANDLSVEIEDAIANSDLVIISGGSSAGKHDISLEVLSKLGSVLFHGLALKPGKPTMAAKVSNKLVFGLPGHPLAAELVFKLIIKPFIVSMMFGLDEGICVSVPLLSDLPKNHGREACVPVFINKDGAMPLVKQAGLINHISHANGYVLVARNVEGLIKGSIVTAELFTEDI